jgi:hypothetical protein
MQFLIVLLPQLFTKVVVNLQNLKFCGYITIRHQNCGENVIENYYSVDIESLLQFCVQN